MPLTPIERHHVKDWPALLVTIAEVLGVEMAENIAKNLGGYHVRLGQHRRKPPKNRLFQLIGADAYAKLAEHLTQGIGWENLEIPCGPFLNTALEKRMRADLLWDAFDQCRTVSEAAQRAGVTPRTVHRRMKKLGLKAADLKHNGKRTEP